MPCVQHRWARDIVGAPTTQVLVQYLRVWNILGMVVLDPLQHDRFVWRWSPDGRYTASSAYHAFFAGSTSMPGVRELWKAKAPARVKFFFWLAIHGRLWSVERRKRHGLQDDDACVLCGQEPETCDHLFAGCVLTRELWAHLLLQLGLLTLAPVTMEDVCSWWLRQRERFDASLKPAFDSLVLLVSWLVWKERNSRTFSRQPSGMRELFMKVKEADVWMLAGFKTLSAAAPFWLLHLVTM